MVWFDKSLFHHVQQSHRFLQKSTFDADVNHGVKRSIVRNNTFLLHLVEIFIRSFEVSSFFACINDHVENNTVCLDVSLAHFFKIFKRELASLGGDATFHHARERISVRAMESIYFVKSSSSFGKAFRMANPLIEFQFRKFHKVLRAIIQRKVSLRNIV